MFDAVKFGVAIMTDDGYNQFGDEHKFYSYSWKYDKEPSTEKKEKKTENRTDGCTDPSDAFGDCISDRLESIHGGKRRGGGE